MTSDVQKMIVWASGMIEFIGDALEPDGSLLICTARGKSAVECLLGWVSGDLVLRDFGTRIAPSIPEIGDETPQVEAMDRLLDWEYCLRASMTAALCNEAVDIDWTRK